MAMKSYFMDELHSIRAEIVNCKNKTKDPTSVDVKVSELQSKIGILEAENKLLKESCSNKQKLLEVVLEHNSVLIKEKSKHVVNPNDKQVSLNKSTCDSQNHMGLDKSNGKKPEHTKTINNVRNTVKARPNPGASTHDLMDYVKPAMRKKPKALVIHTGTNEIQQEINTMKMVKKLVKVIKEIYSERETEIIFSGLIQREINVKLKRYCESKGYRFVEYSNIDGGFLNRSKLRLNKKGTALLSRNIANVLKYI